MGMNGTVRYTLEKALTVKDLLEILEDMNPDARVLFACDYGDHSHTTQALPVESADAKPVSRLKASAYSQSEVALRDEYEDAVANADADEDEEVVILM